MATFPAEKLKRIPGVLHLAEVIEAEALMKYKDNQSIVTIKGVSEGYSQLTGLDTMMVDGTFSLQDQDKDYTIIGYGIAATLGLNLHDYLNPISVFVPKRDAAFTGGFEQAFSNDIIFPSGVFQIQYEYDVKYALVPLRFAKRLTGYENERTSVEIALAQTENLQSMQEKIESTVGKGFVVKNRFQQQEILYQIMNSEKKYIFWILTLILVIATFNVIGTLSMLILDKKSDISVLRSMGADKRLIRWIFLMEGTLISFIGAIAGLIAGAIICYLQIRYGLVRLGAEGSSFVVSAYPVLMKVSDFLMVFFTVMIIGLLAALYPVYNIRRIDTTMTRNE
jgi:lipoprotein-releasing system permease protein